MQEVLTILTINWNMRVKTVINQKVMVVFSNVLTLFSRKILAWSVSNSYNLSKQELVLRLVVEYHNFVNDIR